MRTKRRSVSFSAVAVLERLWMARAGVKTPLLIKSWPGLEESVLFRSLTALRRSRLVRSYRSPARGISGRPPRFWTVTPLGLGVLKLLIAYRDWWELVDYRDVELLSRGIKLLDRLEGERLTFFPALAPIDPRQNYLRTRERYVRHPLSQNLLDTGQGA